MACNECSMEFVCSEKSGEAPTEIHICLYGLREEKIRCSLLFTYDLSIVESSYLCVSSAGLELPV